MTKPTCSAVENGEPCENTAEKCGLCGKHYRRRQRHGTTDLLPRAPRDNLAHFWPQVNKNGPIPAHCPELGPCWVWAGGCDKGGYGVFWAKGEDGRWQKTKAHRWLLGQIRGNPLTRDVVGEEDACHHCDNPPCVNPDHLYIGTRKQNIADAVERKRLWQLKKDTCPYDHPLDGVRTENGTLRRYCKTCANAGNRKRRTGSRTHCKNNHPLSGDNVLLCKNGTRKCRICEAVRLEKLHPGFTYQP